MVNNLFKALAENADAGILITAGEGRHVYANRAAGRITGYAVAALMRMGIRDLVHPEETPKILDHYRRRLEGEGAPDQYETVIVHKSGKPVTVAVTAIRTVWRDEPADLVIFRDVTRQKETEKRLTETEKTLSEIAMNIPGAVFQVALKKDGSFDFPYLNETMQRFYDHDVEALQENPGLIFQQVPGEDLLRNRKLLRASAERLTSVEFEHRVKLRDGSFRWLHVRGTPHALESGEIVWNAVAIDVTERKEAERALEKERKSLARRVRRRTKQLDARNRELEEVNAALKVLLEQREKDRSELEETVLAHVNDLLLPHIERLESSNSGRIQKRELEILKSKLNRMVSPFSKNLGSAHLRLTPAQIEVADLIRQGKSTKEIAELLNISVRTAETHRKILRRRLGIQHRKINLRSYLMSLDK